MESSSSKIEDHCYVAMKVNLLSFQSFFYFTECSFTKLAILNTPLIIGEEGDSFLLCVCVCEKERERESARGRFGLSNCLW